MKIGEKVSYMYDMLIIQHNRNYLSVGLMCLLFLNKVTFDVSVTLEQCPQEQAEYQKRSVLYLKSVNWNMHRGKDAHARELFHVYFVITLSK